MTMDEVDFAARATKPPRISGAVATLVGSAVVVHIHSAPEPGRQQVYGLQFNRSLGGTFYPAMITLRDVGPDGNWFCIITEQDVPGNVLDLAMTLALSAIGKPVTL